MNNNVLVEVNNLKVYYPARGNARKGKAPVKAVDGISFIVNRGETFGIVGESGCGKSTTGKALTRLIKPVDGEIILDGVNLFGPGNINQLELAKKVQMIFQDSMSSLDPRFNIGKTIEEPLIIHKSLPAKERRERVYSLLEDVGLRKEQYGVFPGELSGGQRQRVGIARALALNPELLVCDEPVSALDVSIQAQILNLLKNLQNRYRLTYIFISHNLSVVRHICDRAAVMYLGHIVELGSVADIFNNPIHPYTKALLDSVPAADPDIDSVSDPLEGDVPSPSNPPAGCVFHTRCKFAMEICKQSAPPLKEYETGHMAACARAGDI